MKQARHCDDLDALRDVAQTLNAEFEPPLPDAEVVRTASSAWNYTLRGSNWFGRGAFVVTAHDEIDRLLEANPDALILLMYLRRHHWAREFVVANGLAEHMPGGRWTLKRLAAARKLLIEHETIIEVRPASSHHGPALYRFETGHN